MWGWLQPLLDWLARLIERKAREPRTLEDANTPENIRRRWADSLAARLRDKDGGD